MEKNMKEVRFLPPALRDVPEPDRLGNLPHPREMLSLLGQGAAEAEFLALHASGTLHHAFLLTGPEGVGKATFAYHAARFLLGEGERDERTLDMPSGARAATLIANEAHPDLSVLRRRYDAKTKKTREEISVEDTREALGLFAKTAAFGGWRVIIVDAADDLNIASANALLKTLEEPPPKAVFFLIAHQPQKLLPTIRSRCRRLACVPLGDGDMAALMRAFGGADDAIITRAEGSIRQAMRLKGAGLIGFLQRLDAALEALPRCNPAEIDAIAEATRSGAEGAEAFADFLRAIEAWLMRAMRQRLNAGQGAGMLAPFAEEWARMMEQAARVEAVNLDRRAFVITSFDRLAGVVSGAAS